VVATSTWPNNKKDKQPTKGSSQGLSRQQADNFHYFQLFIYTVVMRNRTSLTFSSKALIYGRFFGNSYHHRPATQSCCCTSTLWIVRNFAIKNQLFNHPVRSNMESHKPSHPAFVFPQPDITPEYTPEDLTPTASQTDLLASPRTTEVPNMVAEPQLDVTIHSIDDMPIISRFLYLLHQSTTLVNTHGPYTSYAGTTVFSRAPRSRETTNQISKKDLATSLAAAQDCAGSAQVEGPAREDLAVFENLWNTTISVLETVLESGDLHHEIFGWGVIGLCAGYIGHSHWREDSPFLSLKTRLHDALKKMPSMDSTYRKTKDGVASAGGMVGYLAKTNREIHVCANLLLQQFRREEWKRIRWYHAVAVAQKWIENLGLENEPVRSRKESVG
jgi:hypothetical protein